MNDQHYCFLGLVKTTDQVAYIPLLTRLLSHIAIPPRSVGVSASTMNIGQQLHVPPSDFSHVRRLLVLSLGGLNPFIVAAIALPEQRDRPSHEYECTGAGDDDDDDCRIAQGSAARVAGGILAGLRHCWKASFLFVLGRACYCRFEMASLQGQAQAQAQY